MLASLLVASGGGSSGWQSVMRGTGSIEADYLNGEIVLLGRLHGVPTPYNEAVRRHANRVARSRLTPGACRPEEWLSSIRTVMLSVCPSGA